MKRYLTTIVFALLMLTSAFAAFGQPTPAPAPNSLPFAAGERLSFEGKINKFKLSVTIGDIVFEVADLTDQTIRLKVDAESRGTMLKLFRYSFAQKIDTLADARDLHAISSKKYDAQKQKVRDSVTNFDYGRKMVTWIETNPDEPTQPARTIASDLPGPTYDAVTAVYYLRTLPLAVGYSTTINISDSGLVYKVPIRVAARELQKTVLGEVWCWRVEPEIFGRGRIFGQKGSMQVWITDDVRRIPVRARVNAEVGKADIRLKETANLK